MPNMANPVDYAKCMFIHSKTAKLLCKCTMVNSYKGTKVQIKRE